MTILKNTVGWIYPFIVYHPGAIHPIIQIVQWKATSTARNLINSALQTESTTFAFSSVFILLLWQGRTYTVCYLLVTVISIIFTDYMVSQLIRSVTVISIIFTDYRVSQLIRSVTIISIIFADYRVSQLIRSVTIISIIFTDFRVSQLIRSVTVISIIFTDYRVSQLIRSVTVISIIFPDYTLF